MAKSFSYEGNKAKISAKYVKRPQREVNGVRIPPGDHVCLTFSKAKGCEGGMDMWMRVDEAVAVIGCLSEAIWDVCVEKFWVPVAKGVDK